MNENELKHWGILNMKWGLRRFQNPDGSLTEEGRKRYNVGPPRDKSKSLIPQKAKKPEDLSDDELYQRSKRNRNLANYYNAQNDYIKSQAYYNELTKPKKKTSQFLQNVFVKPIETVLSKSVEFGLYASAASFMSVMDPQQADRYMNFVTKNNGNNNKNNNGNGNGNNGNNGNNNNGQRP